MMGAMNKYIVIFLSIVCFFPAFGQKTGDVEVVTDSDRSISLATRIYSRPKMIDTSILLQWLIIHCWCCKKKLHSKLMVLNPQIFATVHSWHNCIMDMLKLVEEAD